MLAGWNLQKAIFAKLTAAITKAPVYDNAPPLTPMPYISIGDDTAVPFDDKSSDGFDATITIHAWSASRSRQEVKDLLAAIYGALHNQPLTIAGQDVVYCRWEFSDSFRDEDGKSLHGVCMFRIVMTRSS